MEVHVLYRVPEHSVVKIFQDTPALLETNFTTALKKLDPQEQAQIAAILQRIAALMGADELNVPPVFDNHAGGLAAGMKKDDLVVVNLSGRGDKDIDTVAKLEGITV